MAALSHSESRRKYSWWWDSHISPKNSKWLQENLTDMDAKVKSMIKLIEEDADSFARRAEMYYKQRPELMRLVEQFYRAYRALAERYNHATGELCHAHRAIARVFPEHLPPPELSDDCSPSRSLEHDPHTPGAKLSVRAIFEKNNDQADGLFPNSESESRDFEVMIARGAEKEAQDLKKALAEMRAEKEDVLVKYEECMEKLSSMEVELDNAEKNAKRLEEKAGLAEIEVKTLKEGMVQLEVERNAGLIKHEQCLHKIADLEDLLAQAEEDKKGLDTRAVKAESEAQALKEEISRSWLEKEAVFRKCEEYLDKISALESIVSLTENEGRLLREKAENAENEVSRLKRALADLNRETEASALRYRCCRDTITKLEKELSSVKEHVERLNKDVSVKNVKLEKAEENHKFLEMSNFSLKIEAESLARKIASKDRELSEKEVELENFTVCLREENFRRVQIETTLQSLQNLHSQSQDDQRALKEELENVLRMLKDLEGNKGFLEEELLNIRDENQSLVEKNLSSAVAMGNMQNEILGLREIKERLEKEVSNHIDLSNSLQMDIMSLKEEIKRLNERYRAVVEQVEVAGLNPSCSEATVRSLRDEKSNLRQIRERGARENVTLSEKLESMQELLREKVTCGNYALDMKAELESSRKEAKALQESCQLVEGEKATLVTEKASLLSQLETVTETMHKLLGKNAVLEISLSAAKVELEGLREKSKGLEEICELLKNERSFLLNERGALASKLGTVERRLISMEKRYNGLEKKCIDLEKEKYAMHCQIEELKDSLSVEKQERTSSKIQSETKLAGLKEKIHFLQEENIRKKKDFEEELEKSHKAHFEISILQKFMKDMDEKNSSLITECQKHIKTSELTEKLISELEVESLEQQVESEILLDEIKRLRLGMFQIFRALETTSDCEGENERHLVDRILGNIEVLKSSITEHEDNKDLLLVENSILLTFLEQLESKGVKIESQKIVLEREIKAIDGNIEMARNEKENFLDLNRKLKLDVLESKQHATVLESEIYNLRKQADFYEDYVLLKKAYSQANMDKKKLSKKLCDLEEEKILLDRHNDTALIEYLAADTESAFLRSFCEEKISELNLLLEDLKRQQEINRGLEREMSLMTDKVQFQESENFLLKDSVSNYAREMQEMKEYYEQMKTDIVSIKESLLQTEAKLLDSEVKLQAAENLNLKLFATVDELKIDIQSSIRIKENLEKNVLELSEKNMTQKSEIESLRAVQTNLETELGQLHEEIKENIIKEQILSSELQERNNEFELWESEATGFYFDLQISSVHEIFLVNKLQELAGVCRNLEDENTSKTSVIQEMKEEICSMENEISGLKSQLCAYGPMVAALREDVRVLENNACLQKKVKPSHNREPEEHPEAAFDPCKRASETPPEDDFLASLQTLRTKIKTISKLMEQTNKPMLRRMPSTRKHREKSLSTDETETPPSQPIRCLGRNRPDPPKTHKLKTKNPCGTSTMKDIPLDRASNGLRSRWTHRAGDQMLELWENPELTIGESLQLSSYKIMEKDIIFNQGDKIKYNINKPELHLTDSDLDKELRVDRLGLRRKSTENERRILERLLSDGARLENLWTTLGILREKLEETEKKGWKSKKVDPEMVWEQLAEAEDMVEYLAELNGQLVRNIESCRLAVRKSSPKAREAVRMRRRKVGEQAKRGSERIGRLQLELQKIQYILLRMEEERSNGKGRGVFFRSKSFVLRDFIRKRNGGKLKKKKGQLCGCFRSPSSGNGQS